MPYLRLHGIHKAVLRNDLDRVRTFLRHKKSRIDVRDGYGSTPLMLAAMIGSPKLVTFLLERRASWKIRDCEGHAAFDYVQGPFAALAKDRYKVYTRLSPAKSSRARWQLAQHLGDLPALKTQYGSAASGTLFFQRVGRSLHISKLIAKVNVSRPISRNTTTACIAVGDTVKPTMCAIGGWTCSSSPGVLDGQKYTQLVRDITS
jgi:ankyrin repeat protein